MLFDVGVSVLFRGSEASGDMKRPLGYSGAQKG